MRLGIKEFRERLSEIARGTEPVEVTHHGRVVGDFVPRRRDPERVRAAAAALARSQEELRANGIDLEAELAAMGLSPWGEPLDADSDR